VLGAQVGGAGLQDLLDLLALLGRGVHALQHAHQHAQEHAARTLHRAVTVHRSARAGARHRAVVRAARAGAALRGRAAGDGQRQAQAGHQMAAAALGTSGGAEGELHHASSWGSGHGRDVAARG
jgi:hypothetical protein